MRLATLEQLEPAAGGSCLDGRSVRVDRCQLGSGRGSHSLAPLRNRAHTASETYYQILKAVNLLDGNAYYAPAGDAHACSGTSSSPSWQPVWNSDAVLAAMI